MPIDILRIQHCNVNVSDLERSLHFYRDVVGLTPLFRTNPPPQDGSGFSLPGDIQWDAWGLHGASGPGGTALDLLEWKLPKPTGMPYQEANHLGFSRICFRAPDLNAVQTRFLEAGATCLSPPGELPLDPERKSSVRALFTRDPDGTLVEFIEQPGSEGVDWFHVNINCSDLSRSREWYERVLGLEARATTAPGPVPGELFGFEADYRDECEYEAAFLFPNSDQPAGMAIELMEWKRPAPIGPPYAEANHLGIYRMALVVEDIHASYDSLRSDGVECPDPVLLDMGPEIPIEGVWAVFLKDPDGTCLELIQFPTIG